MWQVWLFNAVLKLNGHLNDALGGWFFWYIRSACISPAVG